MASPVAPTALLLLGPTASGKTKLALRLARQCAAIDVISVDSAMVYRGLDIGTAKPDAAILAQQPHALIDIRDPTEPYSAAAFLADAKAEVAKSLKAGRIPLLVGGSMLYFKVLRTGLAHLPSGDAATRARIEALATASGWPAVHETLAALDPVSAERLSPHDSQRLMRALEVCWLTGTAFSELRRNQHQSGLEEAFLQQRLQLKWLALNPPRPLLRQRILARFQAMLGAGLVDEVRRLARRRDVHVGLSAMRTVGYRQIYRCIQGDADWDEMPNAAITATCQIAKRQQTWMRQWPDLEVLPIDLEAAGAQLCRQLPTS